MALLIIVHISELAQLHTAAKPVTTPQLGLVLAASPKREACSQYQGSVWEQANCQLP